MSPTLNIYNIVMDALRAKRIRQRQVADESGVPFSTVSKIAQGSVKDPSVHTIQKLYEYFTARDAAARGLVLDDDLCANPPPPINGAEGPRQATCDDQRKGDCRPLEERITTNWPAEEL